MIIIRNGHPDFGYRMVHHGTSWYKYERGIKIVEFSDFFSMMKNRISDGADTPSFFRELISMITVFDYEESDDSNDPSKIEISDETIRSYVKPGRGLPKKFAQSIVYNLSPQNFIESLNTKSAETLKLLADDFKAYDPDANEDNVAEKLANIFVDIIKTKAGTIDKDKLEKISNHDLEIDLKRKYGNYLINEEQNTCPFPGCGQSLTCYNKGYSEPSYNVAIIDKKKKATVDNLLAMCPNCYAKYLINSDKKICSKLKENKKLLSGRYQSAALLDENMLEKGIVGVISNVSKLKPEDIEGSSLDPKEIKQKILPEEDLALFNIVNMYVSQYFLKVHEIMINADKSGKIDYEDLQNQMHSMYKKLNKEKKTKIEIFNEITKKLHKISLMEEIYCQIVTSYFVQSCEVFDAITK